jgi:hypothetical protein
MQENMLSHVNRGHEGAGFQKHSSDCCLVLCDKHHDNGQKRKIQFPHLFLFDSSLCFREDFGWGAGSHSGTAAILLFFN